MIEIAELMSNFIMGLFVVGIVGVLINNYGSITLFKDERKKEIEEWKREQERMERSLQPKGNIYGNPVITGFTENDKEFQERMSNMRNAYLKVAHQSAISESAQTEETSLSSPILSSAEKKCITNPLEEKLEKFPRCGERMALIELE